MLGSPGLRPQDVPHHKQVSIPVSPDPAQRLTPSPCFLHRARDEGHTLRSPGSRPSQGEEHRTAQEAGLAQAGVDLPQRNPSHSQSDPAAESLAYKVSGAVATASTRDWTLISLLQVGPGPQVLDDSHDHLLGLDGLPQRDL